MCRLRLPHGEEMPRLGLGTFELLGADRERVVAHALPLGYRHVDTAEGYRNELEVRRALRRRVPHREQRVQARAGEPVHLPVVPLDAARTMRVGSGDPRA